jgi:hypothetical protein
MDDQLKIVIIGALAIVVGLGVRACIYGPIYYLVN